MSDASPAKRKPLLALRLAVIILFYFTVIGSILFGLAGTFAYPGAWILLATFFAVALSLCVFFARRDPEFLRKRMDYSEREKPQKILITFALIPFTAIFAIPPLDVRFGWTPFSWAMIIAGEALFILSYAALTAVFLSNRWAARTVKIQEGQKVVDTGAYAIVRHPMYALVPFLYAAIPLVLQSPWGLVPLPFVVAVLVIRILNEEKVLREGLPGYVEYCAKVRWRLLPFIW